MQQSDTGTADTKPEFVTCEQTPTAVVRGVVPPAELTDFFDKSFRVIPAAMGAQGATMTGPAFGLFNGEPGETVDLEVGFTTDRAIRPDGDVVPSSLPAGRTARLLHSGAFDGLGASWERLRAWIGEQDLNPGATCWEVYVTEPSPDMDPRDLRVELNWPVYD